MEVSSQIYRLNGMARNLSLVLPYLCVLSKDLEGNVCFSLLYIWKLIIGNSIMTYFREFEVVREIAALAIKHDLLVLSDEIYADMM